MNQQTPCIVAPIGSTHPATLRRQHQARKDAVAIHDARCYYCGKALSDDALTIDHVIPLARGGERYDWRNLVPACKDCNAEKGTLTIEEYRWRCYIRGSQGRKAEGLAVALGHFESDQCDVWRSWERFLLLWLQGRLISRFPKPVFAGERINPTWGRRKIMSLVKHQEGA